MICVVLLEGQCCLSFVCHHLPFNQCDISIVMLRCSEKEEVSYCVKPGINSM